MVIALWTMKGGSGCSTVAALVALWQARRGEPVVVVDLGDDLASVFGVEAVAAPTLDDVARLGPGADPAVVAELGVEVMPGLTLVEAGTEPLGHVDTALGLLADADVTVVVDVGLVDGRAHPWALAIARGADRSVLVTRACYLGLRRCRASPVEPTGVVVVREPGRALDNTSIEQVVGAPVEFELALDPVIARSVDAGLLRCRVPVGLGRALAGFA